MFVKYYIYMFKKYYICSLNLVTEKGAGVIEHNESFNFA